MRHLLVAATLLGLVSCIDLEGAYAECVASGRCADDGGSIAGTDAGSADSGTVDGGSTDAGGIDAGVIDAGGIDAGGVDAGGTDAGGLDAGGIDAGFIDAGASCLGSPRKLLRCDPPIDLDGGTGIGFSALAAIPEGFLAGWTGDLVVVKRVSFDGGVVREFTRTAPDGGAATNGQLALDSKGNDWVAVWIITGDDFATCQRQGSGFNPQVRATPSGPFRVISAALSADGGIAVAGVKGIGTGGVVVGAHGSGFPTTLPTLPFQGSAWGGSVVSTRAGFRYVYSGNGNQGSLTRGTVAVGAATDAGLVVQTYLSTSNRPGKNAAVVSTSGDNVLVTFDGLGPTVSEAVVSVHGTPIGLMGPSGTATEVTTTAPDWWVIGTCGPGCVVSGVVPLATNLPVTLSFFTDDPTPAARGAWDLLCTSQTNTTLSLASSGGRLGALVTTPTTAKLYVCDLPPSAAP